MPIFEYTAINEKGKQAKGSIEAENARAARTRLRSQGMLPTTIEESRTRPTEQKKRRPQQSLRSSLGERVSAKTLAFSTRQLATLLSAGIPLVEALQSLAEQTVPTFRRMLVDIKEQVEQGTSFARALGSYPKVFPRLYVNMVASGEASGKLDSVVTSLAEYLEAQLELRRKLISALIYPVIMLSFCSLVVAGLLAFVVPQIVEIFTKQGAKLPVPTRIMIAISDILVFYWYAVALVLVGLVLGSIRLYRTEKGRAFVDSLLYRAPLVGGLYTKVLTARITRTLGTLLTSGVGLLESLDMAKNVVGNVHFQRAMADARDGVTEGRSLSRELLRSKLFPPMACQMIAVGERSGRLEEMLSIAGATFEKEASSTIAGLTALIEPLMIIVLGGIVLAIVVSVLLPLTELMDLVAV
jgi:general secretion pathway protein F